MGDDLTPDDAAYYQQPVPGTSFTRAQLARASATLYWFAHTWGLPLNGENLDTIAYAMLCQSADPNVTFDPSDPRVHEQIERETVKIIEQDAAAHAEMLKAWDESIARRRAGSGGHEPDSGSS